MTRAQSAIWKPLAANWASQSRMTAPDIIALHTMVMSLPACDAMWRKTGYTASHSHFGVGGNGEVWQWQDTAYRAAANYNGNHHIISVETADRGAPFPDWNINDGSAVPAWTPAQCEALARLIAELCVAHNIPCELIPDAKPGRRGIGYHRMGVPGYMVAGAEQWSSSRGKVCPGDRRIAQVPGIVARAQQIANPPTEEFDMATSEELKQLIIGYGTRIENIEKRLDGKIDSAVTGYGRRVENAETDARTAAAGVAQIREDLGELQAALIKHDTAAPTPTT